MSDRRVDESKRQLLLGSAGLTAAAVTGLVSPGSAQAASASGSGAPLLRKIRPGEPGWPSDTQWAALGESMQGEVFKVPDPF